jgi:hypothetical protein
VSASFGCSGQYCGFQLLSKRVFADSTFSHLGQFLNRYLIALIGFDCFSKSSLYLVGDSLILPLNASAALNASFAFAALI